MTWTGRILVPTILSASTEQVNENAKKDLKEGLLLYNTENNVGLKNAWNIIQAEVRAGSRRGGGVVAWSSDPTQMTELGSCAFWIVSESCRLDTNAAGERRGGE